MAFLWNMLRLFCVYFILNIQYSFNGASPLWGESVEPVPLGEFFFMAAIYNKTRKEQCATHNGLALSHICGGSLITAYHVLTAGHCVTSFDEQFDEVEVGVGGFSLMAMHYIRQVSWWTTYSKFGNIILDEKKNDDLKELYYDIAIIKLRESIEDVPLPTLLYIPNEELFNKSVVVAGWGKNEYNRKPMDMQMGRFTVVDPWTDMEKYNVTQVTKNGKVKGQLLKLMLYTDAFTTHTGSGDSGNPILYDVENLDYPNNIVGVHTGCSRIYKDGTSCEGLGHSRLLHYFRGFIESVKNITDDTLPIG